MNIRKKFYIILIGGFALTFALTFFGRKFMSNAISNFTSGKMEGIGSMMGVSNAPVFKSGIFSDDGNYFAYTYQTEVEKPDLDANVTMRGFAYPAYFRMMETATGKIVGKPYEANKHDQMYVVWTGDNWVWLMKSLSNKGNKIALYDLRAQKFQFDFGELEKLNPNVDWKNTRSFYINNTQEKGLILEANDKRYYRIDPNTGKAETVQGKFEMVNYNFAKNFQVSNRNSDRQYSKKQLNGSRQSITANNGKTVSQDDFIDVKFLTLSKNKNSPNYADAPITYYKNNFFVLSPLTSDKEKDLELAMLDKTTLKTIWKIQLPQKELKTFIPNYEMERFFIKGDQLFVSNNDYLMTINLENGKIVKQENLYD
ncbi:hypothetical protein [Soonwooa purpurea]